ncbi:MAG TPA: hypothetical protein DF383_00605 [Deltaproteobacteria bacterium]|nr:hypothetical protein [Deltaproteobacteria bacterium]
MIVWLAMSGPVFAETTTRTSVEHGVTTTHIHQSDDPSVSDPLQGRGVSPKEDRGPANTQVYCEEGSTRPDCVRAEKRQTSPDTTWKDDCASGLSKACPK